MRTLRRLIRGLLLLVVAVVVVALVGVVGLLAAITGRALPQTTGTLRVPGLEAPVSVHRDAAGIAQIVADSPHDLFLAQGYVHAQDRFWQMEVWRHIGAGRLSELFGESTLDRDRYIRVLGWRTAAQRDLDALSEEARVAMDAYAAGVNAWIDANRDRQGLANLVTGLRTGRGSGLGGYVPEPWTPLDSATWQKVQAFNLGGNYDSEIFRMLADAHLGDPALTDELLPHGGPTSPVITPSELLGEGGGDTAVAAAATGAGGAAVGSRGELGVGGETAAAGWASLAAMRGSILELAGLDGSGALSNAHAIGSNNWVIAPGRSATGHALLANDPHLGLAMPSVWYMNGLRCRTVSAACPYDVVGVSFPGAPGVILGHNGRIAWGATNVNPDVQDLYVETVDPANPANYLFDGASLPFETRPETIQVAGGDPVTLTVRSTVHGPILNDVDDRLKADGTPLLALRWTAIAEVDGTFDAILRVNTVGSFAEFRAAFETYGAPSQNFVYADVDGHIGYVLPGLIPIRPAGDRGDRPVDGASGDHEWQGYVPSDELPWQLDPLPGAIVTANNAPVDADYPYLIGREFDQGDRAQRILDLLDALDDDGITEPELRAIQADTYLLRADAIVPRLARLAERGMAPATVDGAALLERILAWDRRCGIDSRGCAAYVPFELTLERAILEDDLGPLTRDYAGSGESHALLVRLLDDPAARWWQDDSQPGDEAPADVVARTLDETAAALREAFGSPDRWTWGRLHTGTFREQTLGSSGIGPLEWYFGHGPFPVPGAAGAVNNNYYGTWRAFADPYDPDFEPVGLDRAFSVTNGPSYRLTIDMGDLDGARIIQTTGQSGNPFDRHHGDLVGPWARDETIPLPFTLSRVVDEAAATLTLVP